jgi:hypothetical protein
VAKTKRKQRTGATGAAAADPPVTARSVGMPDWKWRTFPVFCAFVAGLLIASIVNGVPDNAVAAVLQIAALGGVIYAVVHMFVINVIVAGRIKRREAGMIGPGDDGNSDDGEWVDEVIHPDQTEARR